MKTLCGMATLVSFLLALGAQPAAAADPRNSLRPGDIESVRLNLAPAGTGLGFELEVAGDDPRVAALAELIRGAEPGGGHKCPNAGAIRFLLAGGGVVGIGLLPGHGEGFYGLRLYEGDRFLRTVRVERRAFLESLEELGVPGDDPALRE